MDALWIFCTFLQSVLPVEIFLRRCANDAAPWVNGGPHLYDLSTAGLYRGPDRDAETSQRCPIIKKPAAAAAALIFWNATPAPIVSLGENHCCMCLCTFSDFSVLCIFVLYLCSYWTWGSASFRLALHTDGTHRYAFVCSCNLSAFPWRASWLHASSAETLTYFV